MLSFRKIEANRNKNLDASKKYTCNVVAFAMGYLDKRLNASSRRP